MEKRYKNKYPLGLKILIIFLCLDILINVFWIFSDINARFFIPLSGFSEIVYSSIVILVSITLIIGFIKIKYPALILGIIWYVVGISDDILNPIISGEFLNILSPFIAAGMIAIWYLFTKKEFFRTGVDLNPNTDKKFIILLISMFLIFVLIGMIIGLTLMMGA